MSSSVAALVCTDLPPSYQEATTGHQVRPASCIVTACPCTSRSFCTTGGKIEEEEVNDRMDHRRPGKSVTSNRPLGPFGRTGRRRPVRPSQPDLNHGLVDPSRQRKRVVCRHGCGCFDLLLSFFGP